MGVRFEWSTIHPDILEMHIEAPWTWEEFRVVGDEVRDQMRDHGRPVANIVIVEKMGRLPQGDILGNLRQVDQKMPENTIASVIVGSHYVGTTFMNLLFRIRPSAARLALFVKTVEEAYTLIQERFEQVQQQTVSRSSKP